MESPLLIGVVPDPEHHPDWSRFKAFLEPAAKLAGWPAVLRSPDELVWAVYDGSEAIAAATTRLTTEDVAEVLLVGGRNYRRWLKPLDEMIGRAAKDAGATCLRAFGRDGWERVLGWQVVGRGPDWTAYERGL